MFLAQVIVPTVCLIIMGLGFLAFEYFGNRGHWKRMRALNKKLEDATVHLIDSSNKQTETTNQCIAAQKAATIAYEEYRLVLVAATEEVKQIWRVAGTKDPNKKNGGGWHKN
jgi:hypothetical protein